MIKDKIGQKLEIGDSVAFASEVSVKLNGLVLDVKGGYLQYGTITQIKTDVDYIHGVSHDVKINNERWIEVNKCIKINGKNSVALGNDW